MLDILYNMFPHQKKSGIGEHKMAKNMFPTYTNRQIFEQSDILHAACVLEHIYFKVKENGQYLLDKDN